MNKTNLIANGRNYVVEVRDDADESVLAEIFKKHEYRIVDDVIKNATNPILDIGAHVGFFVLHARSLNAEVPIVAVEPEPNNIAQLKKHLTDNHIDNVQILAGAVAGDAGRRHLRITRDNHNHHLLAREEEKTKEDLIVNTWSLSEVLKKCIIKKVALLKLDIEGGEFEIFRNLAPEILETIDAIFLEYHTAPNRKFQEIENLLRENRFAVQVFPSKYDKKMGFIFAKNKRQ